MNNYSFFKKSENHEFGIKQDNDKLLFVVPEELLIEDKDLISQTKTLFNYSNILFQYYKHKTKESKNQNDFVKYSERDKNFEKLQSLIRLFSDYTANDVYRVRKKNNNNSKKIDWSNTFKKSNILVNKGNIFYSNFCSDSFQDDNENDFMNLYYYALNISNFTFLGSIIFDVEEPKYSINQIKYIINKFLDENYGDRDVFIAKTLESFYLNGSINVFSSSLFKNPYHEKFENIWEFMIEQIIPNNSNKDFKELMKEKKGAYYRANLNCYGKIIIEKEKIANGLNYKIDHIYYNKNKSYLAILDSKFYGFYEATLNSTKGEQPQTESIGKQGNYSKFIKQLLNHENLLIQNFFVFPKKNKGDPELFAIHKIIKETDDDFNVFCISINIHNVIDCFLKNRKMNKIEELLLKIGSQ